MQDFPQPGTPGTIHMPLHVLHGVRCTVAGTTPRGRFLQVTLDQDVADNPHGFARGGIVTLTMRSYFRADPTA